MNLLKTIVAISVLFGSTSVLAQTALPQAATPPAIITTTPNETAAGAVATTNKVYVDQSGQNVDVNIEQTGSSNIIGLVADPIYLRGDNQNVIIKQTGNLNKLLMSIISDTGSLGAATVTFQQLGNSNEADIRCGAGANEATCNSLDMNIRFAGNSNKLFYRGTGSNITTTMDIQGNSNEFNMDVLSPNASQYLKFVGDFNNVDITQTGTAGANGHSLWADFTGTNNVLTVQQDGTLETVINVKSVGSNGVWNIKTGH